MCNYLVEYNAVSLEIFISCIVSAVTGGQLNCKNSKR